SARAEVEAQAPSPSAEESQPEAVSIRPVEDRADARVKASPLARRMARERGIDLTRLSGTGPDGRIVAEDVETAAAGAPAAQAAAPPPAPGGRGGPPDPHRKTDPPPPPPAV